MSKDFKDVKLPRKKPGIGRSKLELYQAASREAPDAILTLAFLMRNSKQDSVRVSAAKTLLNKCLPDLIASKLEGTMQDGGILIKFVNESSEGKTP